MADSPALSDLISVRGRFVRSVHLERDLHNGMAADYRLMESSYEALRTFARALDSPADRAMSLIGPYGSGKSAFCLSLARLLNGDSEDALHELPSLDPALDRRLRSPGCRLIPVPLVGSRQPIARALVRGLLQALEGGGHRALRDHLVEEYASTFNAPSPSSREIADLYRAAAARASEVGAAGVLLILDELGKFLEYATHHPQDGDLFVLQELAEAASRSAESPLVLLTVLHQNIEAYAQRLGRVNRAEWAKIGERFRQIPFFPSDLERMSLAGSALRQRPGAKVSEAVAPVLAPLMEGWLRLDLPHGGLGERLGEIARAAYPLHPLALLALPALFRKSGQSHRSLFQFLSGEEPNALGRFLRETPADLDRPLLYTPDRLFDYAAETLIGGWSGAQAVQLWAEAAEAVERAEGLPETALRALKTVALFGILKEPRLPPTEAVLSLALSDGGGAPADLREGLGELVRRKLAVHRRRSGTYRLWEGGDIDVEAELSRARIGLSAGTTFHVARSLCPPPRFIARRHSYETGTIRAFQTRIVSAEELEKELAENREELTLLYVLASHPVEAEGAVGIARQSADPHRVTAVAVETETLRDAAMEIAAAAIVEREADGIEGDRAARRELSARQQEAEAAFREEWDRLFGARPGGAAWLYRGEPRALDGPRAFSRLLSEAADRTYPRSPWLRNELVNRRSLSSAAAAGRRNLIEAMLDHEAEERLGLKGFPPEVSMYECLLRATGLHREIAPGEWALRNLLEEDPARLRPVWDAMNDFVFGGPPEPRPLEDLYRRLAEPPYGLTEGVLPVLVCAFLRANGDEASLYRQGTFLPEAGIAEFEVLLRRPEFFEIAGVRVEGARAAVVERLARGLHVPPAVVPVVRALIRMVKGLPEYAQKTRRLSPEALAVRAAFEKARSPEKLLFSDLPEALGVSLEGGEPGDPDEAVRIERFFETLNAALRELGEAAPRVIAEARDRLLSACGLPEGGAGWADLRRWAREAEGGAASPRLLPLAKRAAPGEDDAALESVLALIAHRPPRSWSDADAARFPAQAEAIGEVFKEARRADGPGAEAPLSEEERAHSRQLALRWREEFGRETPARILRAALRQLLADLGEEPGTD